MKTQLIVLLTLVAALANPTSAQIAVKGKVVHTLAGRPIENGVVLVKDGKITAVGSQNSVTIPEGYKVVEAAVVTPGFVDARATVGLTGIFNAKGSDQDQLDSGGPIQPELRALDAYNPHERLVSYVRGFGVTTVNTGHSAGKLFPGQTAIFKTHGNSADAALVQETGAVLADLSTDALSGGSPGTRGKAAAMLRSLLLRTREAMSSGDKAKSRSLQQEMLVKVLSGKLPLMVTAHKAQDIATAVRMMREFKFRLILDGAADAPQMIEEIKAAKIPVVLHPTMERAGGDTENLSFETASKLAKAGIPFAIQTGYEPYVPKVRVLVFEAAIAAANGLTFEQALHAITLGPARILGIDKRVGSLAEGKDADLALFDGDPFEYATHCLHTIVNGQLLGGEGN